jgi:hypothetical protein
MDVLLEDADKRQIHRLAIASGTDHKGMEPPKNYFETIINPGRDECYTSFENQYFVAMYKELSQETTRLTDQFIKTNNYKPPFWQLVKLARNANEMLKAD